MCFGKRSGNTAREFSEVFSYKDIRTIVSGVNQHAANCLYISSIHPNDINDLLEKLNPIDEKTIRDISKDFKIAYRPINPMTEGSNRGKCIYTMFKPYSRLQRLTVVDNLNALNKLGIFKIVNNDSINHNRLIKELKSVYNIEIPVK